MLSRKGQSIKLAESNKDKARSQIGQILRDLSDLFLKVQPLSLIDCSPTLSILSVANPFSADVVDRWR